MAKFFKIAFLIALFLTGPFLYGQAVRAVRPERGSAGDRVAISGSGFLCSTGEVLQPWMSGVSTESPPGSVEFNGVSAEIISWHDNVLLVRVPRAATSGPLRVILPHCRGRVVNGGRFQLASDTAATGPPERPAVTPERPTDTKPHAEQRKSLPPTVTPPAQKPPAQPPVDSRALARAFDAGYQAFLNGEFEQAISYLRDYVSSDGLEKGRALFYMGAAKCAKYFLEGERTKSLLEDAYKDFERARRLQPYFDLPPELISPKIIKIYRGDGHVYNTRP
jgi:hypothetical protein